MKLLSSNKLKFSILAILFSAIAIFSFGDSPAFAAAGGTGPGGRKATTDYRHSAKAGATWAYYQYAPGGSGPVTITGWNHGNTTVVDQACRQYGGFYALVFLEYDAANSGDTIDYTGRTGGTVRLNRIKGPGLAGGVNYITGASVSDTAGDGDASIVASGEDLGSVQQKFNSMPADAKWGYSWDANSTLNWFCYGGDIDMSTGLVYSTSAVTFVEGGSTMTSGLDGKVAMNVSRNNSIPTYNAKFTHRIVVGERPSNGFNGLSIEWQVRDGNTGGGSTLASGIISPTDESAWQKRIDGKWEIIVNTSANIPLSGTKCQQIWYKPKHVKIVGGVNTPEETSYMYYSEACISINNIVPPVPTCDASERGTTDIFQGTTIGDSKTQNMNVSTTSWSREVFARPGDTVRFQHCFGYPVQYVKSSSSDGVSDVYITGDPSTSPNNTLKNSFYINAKIDETINNNYLFGLRKDEGSLGPTITLQRHTAGHNRDGGGVLDVDNSGLYWLELLSPTTKAVDKTRYDCLANDFAIGFVSNGFHIPGYYVLKTGTCKSAAAVGSSHEVVGKTIKQSINYPEIRGWVTWRHLDTGRCDCINDGYTPSNSRTIFNYGPNSWANKASNGNKWGKSYYTGNVCIDTTCSDGEKGSSTDSKPCTSRRYNSNYCTCTQTDVAAVPAAGANPAVPAYSKSTVTCNGYTDKSHSYAYPTNFENAGLKDSTAMVHVPYSYVTAVTSSILEGDVIFAGESVESFFTASILPRIVTDVKSTTNAYATIYPGSLQVEQFILGPDKSSDVIKSGETAVSDSICRTLGGSQCGTISVTKNDNWLNNQGRYQGWSWSDKVKYDVPNDVPIGSKYCVAIGMTSADSHSKFDQKSSVTGMSNKNDNWNISVSCRAIAKKPNFQAWNANMYTQGDILTSLSKKNDNAHLGTKDGYNRVFGSWEEYVVISKSSVNNFASGAALGYGASHLNLPGGLESDAYNVCDASKMTISNISCGDNSVGNAKINISDVFLDRLYARYAPASNIPSEHVVSDNGGINNGNLDSFINNYTTATDSSNPPMQYIKTHGDAVINGVVTRGLNTPGLVIYVQGTLRIDHNICYGSQYDHDPSGSSCVEEKNDLVLAARNSTLYSHISDLPQIIIIADNIEISQNVSQIDAWVIAEGSIGVGAIDNPGGAGGAASRGAELGTLDTCYERNPDLGADSCNKTLIINGPVAANRIYLNRTAGAYTRGDLVLDSGTSYGENNQDGAHNNLADDGSITPAEIFNFRPDILLWSYQQSQNFSQATVTYTHELPPRY